jgi:hypothetical protein
MEHYPNEEREAKIRRIIEIGVNSDRWPYGENSSLFPGPRQSPAMLLANRNQVLSNMHHNTSIDIETRNESKKSRNESKKSRNE